jgi:hypothetical protein
LPKKRNNRNTFSEIIMDMFLANGEKILFLPEKSTRGHTDFIYGIEFSLYRETLCKRREIIKICFPR